MIVFWWNLVIYRKEDGFHITKISSQNTQLLKKIDSGPVSCEVTINDFNLNPGYYTLVIAVFNEYVPLYRNVAQHFFVKLNRQVLYKNSILDLSCGQKLSDDW